MNGAKGKVQRLDGREKKRNGHWSKNGNAIAANIHEHAASISAAKRVYAETGSRVPSPKKPGTWASRYGDAAGIGNRNTARMVLRLESTCLRGSKKIKQRGAPVALTLVAPRRDLLRSQYDSVSREFDEELMVL